MSDKRKPEGGAPSPDHDEPLRDLSELPEPNTEDQVRGGRVFTPPLTPATPPGVPMPYPN